MYLEMLVLRVIASVILAVLLLQALRYQTDFSTDGLLKARIRWVAIIILLVFICLGLRIVDSDPIQFNPNHATPNEIQAIAIQVLENKQNLLRLSDFYTFIPLGFCFGIVIYGISQIIISKRKKNEFFEKNNIENNLI